MKVYVNNHDFPFKYAFLPGPEISIPEGEQVLRYLEIRFHLYLLNIRAYLLKVYLQGLE